MRIREARFALRVVRRREGTAGIVYRRILNRHGQERLTNIGSMSPLVFSAGASLLRAAARGSNSDRSMKLASGPYIPLDNDWGARVACYAMVATGARDLGRLHKAASEIHNADGTEAAWWLGLMTRGEGRRAIRALRILTGAVQ